MLITKYVGALAMSAALCVGCQGPELQEDTDQVTQGLKVWTGTNTSLAIGGVTGDGGRYPTRGIQLTGKDRFVMTATDDHAARISSIRWDNQNVTALSAPTGVLQATVGGVTVTNFTAAKPLLIYIGDPIGGTLRIYTNTVSASYNTYTTDWSPDSQQWNPYCPHEWVGPTQGGSTTFVAEPMVPIGGAKWSGTNGDRIEDPYAITMACAHDAIGGCVGIGYVPWETGYVRGSGTVSLQAYHQTCTRAKRADFCGNGEAHTTLNAGIKRHTPIQIWDNASIYSMGEQTPSSMEAYWSVDGATCFNPTRFRTTDQENSQYFMLRTLPGCPAKPTCDSGGFNSGILGTAQPQ